MSSQHVDQLGVCTDCCPLQKDTAAKTDIILLLLGDSLVLTRPLATCLLSRTTAVCSPSWGLWPPSHELLTRFISTRHEFFLPEWASNPTRKYLFFLRQSLIPQLRLPLPSKYRYYRHESSWQVQSCDWGCLWTHGFLDSSSLVLCLLGHAILWALFFTFTTSLFELSLTSSHSVLFLSAFQPCGLGFLREYASPCSDRCYSFLQSPLFLLLHNKGHVRGHSIEQGSFFLESRRRAIINDLCSNNNRSPCYSGIRTIALWRAFCPRHLGGSAGLSAGNSDPGGGSLQLCYSATGTLILEVQTIGVPWGQPRDVPGFLNCVSPTIDLTERFPASTL